MTDATDEQLRKECERRFGGETFKQSVQILNCKIAESQLEAEHWKTVAESAVADRDRYAQFFEQTQDERDEWKRRAEDLESGRVSMCPCSDCAKRSIAAGRKKTITPHEPMFFQFARTVDESGPGISALPERDNSVAWLDEDLLCEDA